MNPENKSQLHQQLSDTMVQLIDQVILQLEILQEVQQSISVNDMQKLHKLMSGDPQRQQCIERLQTQQTQILHQLGLQNMGAALDDYLQRNEDVARLSDLHRELGAQLKALQNSLALNSLLVQKNRQHISQSIRILSGRQPAATASTTYSSHGNSICSDVDRRTLAQA